jgi:hypothetical protein
LTIFGSCVLGDILKPRKLSRWHWKNVVQHQASWIFFGLGNGFLLAWPITSHVTLLNALFVGSLFGSLIGLLFILLEEKDLPKDDIAPDERITWSWSRAWRGFWVIFGVALGAIVVADVIILWLYRPQTTGGFNALVTFLLGGLVYGLLGGLVYATP